MTLRTMDTPAASRSGGENGGSCTLAPCCLDHKHTHIFSFLVLGLLSPVLSRNFNFPQTPSAEHAQTPRSPFLPHIKLGPWYPTKTIRMLLANNKMAYLSAQQQQRAKPRDGYMVKSESLVTSRPQPPARSACGNLRRKSPTTTRPRGRARGRAFKPPLWTTAR